MIVMVHLKVPSADLEAVRSLVSAEGLTVVETSGSTTQGERLVLVRCRFEGGRKAGADRCRAQVGAIVAPLRTVEVVAMTVGTGPDTTGVRRWLVLPPHDPSRRWLAHVEDWASRPGGLGAPGRALLRRFGSSGEVQAPTYPAAQVVLATCFPPAARLGPLVPGDHPPSRSMRLVMALVVIAYSVLALVLTATGRVPASAWVGAAVFLAAAATVRSAWRTFAPGAHIAWVVPTALPLVGGLLLAFGSLTYLLVESGLGLPRGSFAPTVADRAWAGVVPFLWVVGAALVGLAFVTVSKRAGGSSAAGSLLLSLFVLLGLVSAAGVCIDRAQDEAQRFAAHRDSSSLFSPTLLRDFPVVCATSTTGEVVAEGGRLDLAARYVWIQNDDDHYLLYDQDQGYRRVDETAVSISPAPLGRVC